MKITNWFFFFFLLFVTTLCYVQPYDSVYAVEPKTKLHQELTNILTKTSNLHGAIASVSIRSATTGEMIYDHNGHLRLKPASNLKLFTAVAALSTLGEDYQFTTELHTDGKVRWGMLNGDVYIKGKGDPTLIKADIDHMVDKLHKKGIKVIRGNVVADDSWYDDISYSIDLPWSDEPMEYGSPISALTVSSNEEFDVSTVTVEVQPGENVNEKPLITIIPHNTYFDIINEAVTVRDSHQQELVVTREHGLNQITITGSMPINSPKHIEKIAVWEPTDFALHLFKTSFQENGIKILGDLLKGTTPQKTTLLTKHDSMELAKILNPFMKLSKNGHGDILIKEIGQRISGEGSWEQGIEIMKQVLTQYGVNSQTIVIRDGSGISHVNLIPANELTQLLWAIQTEKWFPVFLNSLPVAGHSNPFIGGTLKDRMKHSEERINAKTGTIATVSSISGYVDCKSGEKLIFSIIFNNMLDNEIGKQIEDQILSILINY